MDNRARQRVAQTTLFLRAGEFRGFLAIPSTRWVLGFSSDFKETMVTPDPNLGPTRISGWSSGSGIARSRLATVEKKARTAFAVAGPGPSGVYGKET